MGANYQNEHGFSEVPVVVAICGGWFALQGAAAAAVSIRPNRPIWLAYSDLV